MIQEVYAQFTTVPLPSIGATGFLASNDPTVMFSSIVTGIIRFVFIIGGLVVFTQFLLAGLGFATSEGDSTKLGKARNKLLWAFVGMIILLFSVGLIILLEGMTGSCFGFSCPLDPCELYPGVSDQCPAPTPTIPHIPGGGP